MKDEDDSGRKRKKKHKNDKNGIREPIDDDDFETKRKKKDKRRDEDSDAVEVDSLESLVLTEKFKWESVMKKVLKAAPEQEISIKKLRKKVVNEFLAHGGDPRPGTEQELRLLFEKKLHKNPKVKVFKERAKLCR